MAKLLDQLSPPPGSGLATLITSSHDVPQRVRKLTEDLWKEFKPYASKDWRNKFSLQFDASFWEMYLTVGLLREGHTILTDPYDDGPDLAVPFSSGRVALEAAILTSGDPSSADRVPERQHGVVADVPRDQTILRYTQTISKKLRQRQGWVKSGKVGPADPFVIAISANPITFTFSDTHPLVLKALCPMDDYTIKINTQTLKATDAFHAYRPEVKKANQSPVETLYFASDKYKEISAVMAARFDPYNNPLVCAGKFFAGFAVAANPFAGAPVPMPMFADADHYDIAVNDGNMSITRKSDRT